MKPMSVLKKECSNYDKILLKSENGFLCLCFGFYEDGMIRIENTYKNPIGYEVIYSLLTHYKKFVLGGSPLFGIGNNTTLSTLGNCFVIDSPLDSYGGIFKADQELAQLMKRRGGVGIDISTLRPKRAKVNNAANSSTGAVSFASRFSNTTREVAQEGRRGALMISMNVDHPDIEDFITLKDDLTKVTGANISVKVTDKFMMNIFYDTKTSKIWDKLIHQAWKSAEPGVLFWDKIISESPADCYEEFKTISTNPCGELPLCAYDSCRLSAINLYAYVLNPFTSDSKYDLLTLEKDVILAQRLMDDVIDLEAEKISKIIYKIEQDPEDEDTKNTELLLWQKVYDKLLSGRRTGLGQMGLADAGAALGLKYGDDSFIQLANDINKVIAINSYKESILMARERGSFPIWSLVNEEKHPYLQRIFDQLEIEDQHSWKYFGRRNIGNLTIAPTGSISMLAKVSSGIEPVFALSYKRKRKVTADNPNKTIQDKQGDWWEEYDVFHSKFKEFIEIISKASAPANELSDDDIKAWIEESPYYQATAHDIDPYLKLFLQSKIQPWIDHSISVTYNLPENVTEEQVSRLYRKAWELGLKGMTVYREGSRDGVLTITKKQKFNQYDAPKRPKDLYCDVYNIMAKGRPWKVFIGLLDGLPYEVFAVNGKIDKVAIEHGILRRVHGGRYDLISLDNQIVIEDITHNMTQEEEAFTRVVSWALRHGAKLEFGVEQLNKAEGDITSFAKAIARTFKKYLKYGNNSNNSMCPNCNSSGSLVSESGCTSCKQCGYSKCD
jgi:ribonucleoside-diphosphate reductase alpha chain